VLGAETIGDPRADRWSDEIRRACVEKERRRTVRHAFGVHAAEDAKLVGLLRDLGEDLRDVEATLAVARELPRRSEHTFGGHLPRARDVERRPLAMIAREARLRVEGVDLARSSLHEEEDHALRSRGEVSWTRRERIARRGIGGSRLG